MSPSLLSATQQAPHAVNGMCMHKHLLLTDSLLLAEAVREDFGDWDLQEALSDPQTRQRVCAVVFGHMHHRLHPIAGGGLRNMAALDPTTATVYLNAAVVPRQDMLEDGYGRVVQVSSPSETYRCLRIQMARKFSCLTCARGEQWMLSLAAPGQGSAWCQISKA